MAGDNKSTVSLSVVRRMSRYLRHLEELENDGVSRISSQMMANQLGLTASQIRQDLNSFGGFGQQGYGYSVEYLKSNIQTILGIHRTSRAVLIGVGNLGRAIIRNVDFKKCGVILTCAFDIEDSIVGTQAEGVNVLHMDKLDETISMQKIQMAILTLPPEPGRKVAEHLVSRGVRGIWNFTGVDLHISDAVATVEDLHFSDSLLTLCYCVGQHL